MVRSSQHSLGLCELVLLGTMFTRFQIRRSPPHSPLKRARPPPRDEDPIGAALLFSYASASNPFSSNVVLLTQKNWAELDKSPFLWLVNVCRQS